MKKWEDIVKAKMEEPSCVLPESVFAEFHARLDGAATARWNRFPLPWLLIPAAVAGIAAVLLLLRPAKPDARMQIIQQPKPPVAMNADSAEVSEPVQATALAARTTESVAQTSTPTTAKRLVSHTQETEIQDDIRPPQEIVNNNDINEGINNGINDDTNTVSSPFVPENNSIKPIGMKVSHAAAIVAGTGLVAGLARPLSGLLFTRDFGPEEDPVMGRLVQSHSFPVKAGVSTRIPLSDRLYLTSGFEYSMYHSTLDYSLAGRKEQLAHYLGVPVRLDWTLASNRWLDVYVGGGLEGSYCLGATQNGVSVSRKDGFGLSLIGTGGIQFNMTKNLGIYVEPELSMALAPYNHVLLTYRSYNSIMFSVGGGIRYSFRK